jgi:hypothetical protein
MFCSSLRRASTEPPVQSIFEFDTPMDLSSLEGAQMVNPKCTISLDTATARIRSKSRTPTHILFSKPLPPRPASTDIASPRQRRIIQSDWPLESPAIDYNYNLKRAPAHRGRKGPPDEIFPDRDPRKEHSLSYAQRNSRTSPLPRRSRSCMPTNLIWLEEERHWIVGGNDIFNTHGQFRDNAAPQSPVSPVSPLSRYIRKTSPETNKNVNDCHRQTQDDVLTRPSYDSHGFGPPHAARSGNERVCRWISVVQRTREDIPFV